MPPEGRADRAHPEAADWLLGNLAHPQAEEFSRHRATCAHCQAAVAEFSRVGRALENLPLAAEPPPGLEARTIASVLEATTPAEQSANVRPRVSRRPHWNARLLAAAAAAAAAAIAAVAVLARPGTQPAHTTTRGAAAAVIVLRSPAGAAATGRAVATRHAGGWAIHLTVHGLKQLPPGQFYECWYAGPGNRPAHPELITAGTFNTGPGGTGSFTMWSAADPHLFTTMQITAEHPGDARQHGQIILTGHARP